MSCVRKKCRQKAEWIPILILRGPQGHVEIEIKPAPLCHRHMMAATPASIVTDKEYHHLTQHFADVEPQHSRTQLKFRSMASGAVY